MSLPPSAPGQRSHEARAQAPTLFMFLRPARAVLRGVLGHFIECKWCGGRGPEAKTAARAWACWERRTP
jgi:hypothetical protein